MDARYTRRFPTYVYLSELVRDRRVLELGCGEGHGAALLLAQGARRVVGLDRASRAVEAARIRYRAAELDFQVADYTQLPFPDGSFDVICMPAGADIVRRAALLPELRRVLAENGLLAVVATSADRLEGRAGVTFHELSDAVGAVLGPPRMIGVQPFVGFSLVEFGDDAAEVAEIELDTQLAEGGTITDYLALAGPGAATLAPRGFVVVQLPTAPGLVAAGEAQSGSESFPRTGGTVPPPLGGPGGPDGEAETRRRLARAQEERAALEAELTQLRQRLGDADIELGRVAAAGAREVELLRARLADAETRTAELEAAAATLRRENLSLRKTPAGGREAELVGELTLERAEHARARAEARELADRVVDLEAELRRAAEPRPSAGGSVDALALLGDAAAEQAKEVAALRELVGERDAYVDELRDELERAIALVVDLRGAASAANARATGLDAELREVRGRMARAEGEALKLKRETPGERRKEAAPAPAATTMPAAPPSADPGLLARVTELEKALADKSDAEAKATARWKAAEAKSDELWRKVGEMQRELEQNRVSVVETAKAQRQAAQINLTRAVDEAGKKLVSTQDLLKRTERERDELEKKLSLAREQAARAYQERDEALAAAAEEAEAVRRERDATVGKARGELELMHAAASRRKGVEQKLAARLEELEQKLGALDGGLREEERRLGELEDGLRTVHQHTTLIPDSTELEKELVRHATGERQAEDALAGRDERLRSLTAELGQRDAELALLHGRVASARQQLDDFIAAVRRTREQLAGRSSVEIAALLDRLTAEASEAAAASAARA